MVDEAFNRTIEELKYSISINTNSGYYL